MRLGKLYIGMVFVSMWLMAGCSSNEQNPEASIESYIQAWESQNYEVLVDFLTLESIEEVFNANLNLAEKYSEVHDQMDVSDIQVSFESRDFEEEDINWDEVTELTYPIQIEFETLFGPISYESDIKVVREIQTNEDGNETEGWFVTWLPNHLFKGVQSVEDEVVYQTVLPQNRGQIFDRNGEELAVNGQIRQVGFRYDLIENLEEEAQIVADIYGMDSETVIERASIYKGSNEDWFAAVMSAPLTDERYQELAEANVPGVLFQTKEGRVYPYAHLTAHLTGDIREVNADDLEKQEWTGYRAGSYIGRMGLELAYEDHLRGEVGFEVRVEDANGKTREVLMNTEPEDGKDLFLTIDVAIQQKLFDSIGDEAGSGVVMDPISGEVLALVSRPVFDPNQVYLNTRSPERDAWLADERDVNRIRFNRTFSPGSVFKPFTAVIGIEEGVLDPSEIVTIKGEKWQPDSSSWGGYQITRVNPEVTDVDLTTAMKYSDNIYFAQKSLAIGADKIHEWAEELGFSSEFRFDYPLNDSQIANESLDDDILLADTGYGQGEVQMNPVHLTALYTMFVNEGNIVQPIFLKESQPELWKEGVIQPSTAETVLNTLKAVVADPNGTAYRANSGHTRILAGKTGTAEIKDTQGTEGDEIGWYTSVDVENPDYLVTVMVEGRSSGAVVDMANHFWASIE
ncbi:penicillin-binding transpeptidase domain-containing protein [Alkalihalobacillus sp. MEB130]|uniref:peptidoglycan D,D-transpeptidase FtsI family protein n=1 Tax=Alkalihalobacillus sp. MEB130 TaxID=2976704 RepID=UPI0028DFAB62|nr:penicillin-binding transpeptidase domain-containing protein [Alkalihalobacillus sp. MEB130]MDT8861407.1 penicillin-binding transpeptidase domain-containing protein [Alkalihalobacillus sp. MEB130]